MKIVTKAERRSTTTPNAVMTTLASPSLGGAATSLWLVQMGPDAVGPDHSFEAEVLWAVTRGTATLREDGRETTLTAGDTVVLPGGDLRQFAAGPDGFDAVATTSAPGVVTRGDGTVVGTPEWVA